MGEDFCLTRKHSKMYVPLSSDDVFLMSKTVLYTVMMLVNKLFSLRFSFACFGVRNEIIFR